VNGHRLYADDVRNLQYRLRVGAADHELRLVHVPGTNGTPYLFGAGPQRRPIEIGSFHIATTPVTQALWLHVMGANPAKWPDLRCPVENVSWEHITQSGGFLDRINASAVLTAVAGSARTLRFRLPSESEWEYAARGRRRVVRPAMAPRRSGGAGAPGLAGWMAAGEPHSKDVAAPL
jgi:hypothetical protein